MNADMTIPNLQCVWISLGYQHEPFGPNNKLNHYRSQSFVSCLNKLLTLDTTNTCIANLCGESGSGKTTCLKTFTKTASIYTNCFLSASTGLTPINILKAIFLSSNVSFPIRRTPCKDDIIHILKALSKAKIKLRIVIDNAEKIPQKTLNFIENIATIQPTGDIIQILLSSTQVIPSLQSSSTQVFSLKNLSLEETKKYIHLRLTRATKDNHQADIPKELVEKIYLLSKGNIVRINNLAAIHISEHFMKNQKDHPEDNFDKQNQGHYKLLLLSPLLVIQAVAIYYALLPNGLPKNAELKSYIPSVQTSSKIKRAQIKSKDIASVAKPKQPTVLSIHKAAVSPNTATKIAASTTDAAPLHNERAMVTAPNILASVKTEVIPSNAPTIENEKSKEAATQALASVKTDTPAKQEPLSEKITTATPNKPILKAQTVQQERTKDVKVQAKLPAGWLVQLAALHSENQAKNFVTKNMKELGGVWYYKAIRAGKSYYLVVTQPFKTKAELNNHMTAHKKHYQKLNAWVRNTDTINKELADQLD